MSFADPCNTPVDRNHLNSIMKKMCKQAVSLIEVLPTTHLGHRYGATKMCQAWVPEKLIQQCTDAWRVCIVISIR